MSKGLQLKYFVLKPKGKDAYAKASRAALHAYADAILNENPLLAEDLRNWANREYTEQKQITRPEEPHTNIPNNDCHQCIHKRNIPGDSRIQCARPDPKMKGDPRGVANGWFSYPLLFDPIWRMKTCDNFEQKSQYMP